jgi:membrane associated rhomboid family serine protease
MFPIGDTEVRGQTFPFVNYAIIVVNVIVFLFELGMSQSGLQNFYETYGVIPTEILHGANLISLFTSMWIHGGWLHIGGNMLFLWVFGDNIEAVMGHIMYLFFYLIGGIFAGIFHSLLNSTSTLPSIGASGAIAAVLGAYIIIFPRSRVRLLYFLGFFVGITRISALIFIGIWFVEQFFIGVASLGPNTAQSGGVAVWAHVGGFLFGLLIGLFLRDRAARLDFGRNT